jgi:hypothetical protein
MKTANVNNAPNRLDDIDLLFPTGPELSDSRGTVSSDVGWKDQCLFSTDDGLSHCGLMDSEGLYLCSAL